MKPARAGLWPQRCLLFLLSWCWWPGAHVWAASTDWGVIPVNTSTTISFASQDITRNFTDQYYFSLASGADASYAVTVAFDLCRHGCGNPDLSYGVYDVNGRMISDTGSVVLSSGRYVFKVKGTGFGAGNTLDYSGSMSFYVPGGSTLNSFVSAVPEPRDAALMLMGLCMLAAGVWHRRRASFSTRGLSA